MRITSNFEPACKCDNMLYLSIAIEKSIVQADNSLFIILIFAFIVQKNYKKISAAI